MRSRCTLCGKNGMGHGFLAVIEPATPDAVDFTSGPSVAVAGAMSGFVAGLYSGNKASNFSMAGRKSSYIAATSHFFLISLCCVQWCRYLEMLWGIRSYLFHKSGFDNESRSP